MSDFADWVASDPARPVLVEAETGRSLSAGELLADVRRAAQWLVALGLQPGDGIALLLENRFELIEVCLAARLAGVYYTPISHHLAAPEIAHVLADSGARVLVVSAATRAVLPAVPAGVQCFDVDSTEGASSWGAAVSRFAADGPLPQRPVGRDLLYSSGTTGRPKGVRRPMQGAAQRGTLEADVALWQRAYGFDAHSVYLSLAPLYHAAPLRYVVRTLNVGGRCVIARRFDPEAALAWIERYRITHSQWVPTMFVRLLQLPEAVRQRHDLGSLRMAVHAAAPCPLHVKQAMLDWWGDIIHEYYAGSEALGTTMIGPLEWRAHPGSVGRPVGGKVHIVGDDGQELATREVGKVYFSGTASFAYLNDPEKTREAYNEQGWATYGDVGWLDEEGYLYLSDRRSDLILSGGVNVYPREIESVLQRHPAVAEVAVVGVPNDDLGEVPLAVVRLRDPQQGDEAMAHALVTFAAQHLGRLKLPRGVVFQTEPLPHTETGKLLHRVLKERYRSRPDAGFAVRPPPLASTTA